MAKNDAPNSMDTTPPAMTSLRRGGPVGRLSGPEKAALWLLSIEEELAIEILPFFTELELELLAASVKTLGKTTPEQLREIHSEFAKELNSDNLHLKGSVDYLGKLAEKALGEERARLLFGEDEFSDVPPLGKADVEVLASVIRNEHPQIIAAVLANLDPMRACEVLERLPDLMSRDVIMRIARLQRVPKEALDKAERLLSAGLPTRSPGDSDVDGVKAAARLLNSMDANVANEILDSMENDTDTVAQDIRQAMFTFDDLEALDRRGFQTLLKEVQSEQLLVALKTASDTLREKIFDSLSKRAAEMLREDLEVMGPVRLQEVQEAQQAVVNVALQLKSDGRLALAGAGDDFV